LRTASTPAIQRSIFTPSAGIGSAASSSNAVVERPDVEAGAEPTLRFGVQPGDLQVADAVAGVVGEGAQRGGGVGVGTASVRSLRPGFPWRSGSRVAERTRMARIIPSLRSYR
jgi:hypothetical protein